MNSKNRTSYLNTLLVVWTYRIDRCLMSLKVKKLPTSQVPYLEYIYLLT